jgi:MFS family permease
VLAVVAGGYLLASWAMNPVSAILPTITADLGIDVTRAGWILNAYFVLLVGGALIAGRLGDAFGHGGLFRAGCLTFAAGSLSAALAGDFNLLIAARAVQGVGSALLVGVAVASGGLPSERRTRVADIDWLGGGLLFVALMFLLLGLNHLHEGPETFEAGAPYHLTMHLIALGFLVVFLWRQLRTPKPLVNLQLLRTPRLSAGVVANGIAHSSMLATSLLIPFLIERGQGFTPTQTQQLLLAMQVSLCAASLLGGWSYARRATPAFGVLSIGAIATGLAVMGRIGAELPYAGLFPVVVVLGAGLGIFTAVNNTSVMTSVSPDQRGFASGLVETTRQLGHSLGVSISSGVLQTALAAAAVPELGYRDGFSEAASSMALVAGLGVLVVLFPVFRNRVLPQPALDPRFRPTE